MGAGPLVFGAFCLGVAIERALPGTGSPALVWVVLGLIGMTAGIVINRRAN